MRNPHINKWKTDDVIRFLATRGIYSGTLVLAGLFLLLSLYRAYPYADDVNETNASGDDWLIYKLNALSILRDGLSLPRVHQNYHLPGGFLYNYFVAFVFAAGGPNSTHVYVVQALLLALSVGMATLAFKPFLNERSVAVYFLGLALISFIDVFCFYTFRLLSENLLLFLLPLFYLLFLRARKSESFFLAFCAGGVLGLCALCRQNLILLGPILGVLLFFYLKRGPYRALLSLTFVVSFCVIFALLPLRNYVVTGEASIPVIRHTAEHVGATLQIDSRLSAGAIFTKAVSAFVYYVKRILFCAGVTVTLDLPWYYLKPHWLVIWFGALLYLGRVLRRRRLEFWEAFASTLIVTYLLPLIAFADISNYGVRMVVPVMPVVFALCSSLPGKASSTVRKE